MALISGGALAQTDKLDVHAERAAEGQTGTAGGRFAPASVGAGTARLDVFIDVDRDFAALGALKQQGAEIRSVLSTGLLTASVPVAALKGLAAIPGVRRIEAARRVEKRMNLAVGPNGSNVPPAGDPLFRGGAGVVVGVLDTGIDIAHPDFSGRIKAIWDHTLDPADVGNLAPNPAGFNYGTEWSAAQIAGGYASCAHRDVDGHGTHVAGTSAGAGLAPIDTANGDPASGYRGMAPQADLVVVKFDFDNVKNRNTDAAIVDGVNWIFQKAAAMGKPAVINMSLGSDYGPHDGTLGDERGLDALTGPGRIVVVAAGNAGRSYASAHVAAWGAPLHGQVNTGAATDEITVEIPAYAAAAGNGNDYVFFDLWYPAGSKNRVQITSPGGKKYPSSFSGANRTTCQTGGTVGSFNTSEGSIYCANKAGASNGWDTTTPDNNLYIEISDSGPVPAAGLWKIDLIPIDSSGGATVQGWNGNSPSLNFARFRYGGALSDNVSTIGAPATAKSIISVGAYQTKNCWTGRHYADANNPASSVSLVEQCYGVAPIDYYDPYNLYDLAFFSSRGPSRDGRQQPFISAPGVGIVASMSQTTLADPSAGYYHRSMNRVSPTGFYTTLQGTSMATPQVTGGVALVLEQGLAVGATNDPSSVKAALAAGARYDAFTGPASGNDWGHGKMDLTGALPQVVAAPNQAPVARAGVDLTLNDTNGDGSETFALSGAASTDADGSIVAWSWTDGVNTWTTPSFSDTRALGGPYVYTLTVTDDVGATSSDTVLVTVQVPVADTVAVTKASYSKKKKQLTVEATSSASPGAVLTATWAGGSAAMAWNASTARYTLVTALAATPASVTVTSSQGGSASRAVTVGP